MTEAGSGGPLTAGVALLERAMGYTLGSLRLVTADRMANRTPCTEWDLHALLLHMNDSLLALHEAVTAGHVELDPAGDCGEPIADPAVDPVAALRQRGCQMIGAWVGTTRSGAISIADRPLSPVIVAATGAVEIAVHGWDVARACGADRPIPPELAAELLELCPLFVGHADRPARFAAPVAAVPSASPSDRLVAFLGRRPDWGREALAPAV